MLEFDGFDWDEANLFKSEVKHGVSRETIEETLSTALIAVAEDPPHSLKEERLLAIGSTNADRYILIVFTFRFKDGLKLIRPISARYMHAKERKKYQKENSEIQDG